MVGSLPVTEVTKPQGAAFAPRGILNEVGTNEKRETVRCGVRRQSHRVFRLALQQLAAEGVRVQIRKVGLKSAERA